MSTHTPGPWYVRPRNGPGSITSEVCYGTGDECITDGVYEAADARLIAAAPALFDLHEADITDLDLLLMAIECGDPSAEIRLRITDMKNRKETALALATNEPPR